MRSMPSTSRVTCSASTSATLRGRLISAPVDSGPSGPTTAWRSNDRTGFQFSARPEPSVNYRRAVGGRQRAPGASGEDETYRASARSRGQAREERDAREGNRRCPSFAPRHLYTCTVGENEIYLVGLRRSLVRHTPIRAAALQERND